MIFLAKALVQHKKNVREEEALAALVWCFKVLETARRA